MSVQLRLYPGAAEQDDISGESKHGLVAQRPELAWRLRDFFELWFAPRYLQKCVKETVRNYYSTIRYWEEITDDWRLVDLLSDDDGSDDQCLDFTDQLPEWGYSRRGIRRGEPIRVGRLVDCPAFTPLSSMTARDHASRLGEAKCGDGIGHPRFGSVAGEGCEYALDRVADFGTSAGGGAGR